MEATSHPRSHGEKRSRRVLVIDDHHDTAEVVCTILRFEGHDCRTAHTGRAGLAQAEAFDPSVVVLDLALPDMSGYDVARALRSRMPSLHIAALSGWDAQDKRDAAFAAGCNQYVLKPVDAASVRDMLSAVPEDLM